MMEALVPDRTACGWGTRYRSVIGQGTARFLTDTEEKRKGMLVIMEQQTGRRDWTFKDASLEKVCVFAVDIGEMDGKENGWGQ
jgi:nitroimidazol reductase NimA-like FMN-containing flavoprotein (pyridoxamine 5'-phosphate oxidase superfamily)